MSLNDDNLRCELSHVTRLTAEIEALQQELFESERYIAWLTRGDRFQPVSQAAVSDARPGSASDYVRSLEKALTAKEQARFALEQRVNRLEDRNILLRLSGINALRRIIRRRSIQRARR